MSLPLILLLDFQNTLRRQKNERLDKSMTHNTDNSNNFITEDGWDVRVGTYTKKKVLTTSTQVPPSPVGYPIVTSTSCYKDLVKTLNKRHSKLVGKIYRIFLSKKQ